MIFLWFSYGFPILDITRGIPRVWPRLLDGCWPRPSRAGSMTLAEGVATSDQSHLGVLGQRQELMFIVMFIVIFIAIDVYNYL